MLIEMLIWHEKKYYKFNLYDLENDLKIQNPAWHPPTPFSVYYELLI